MTRTTMLRRTGVLAGAVVLAAGVVAAATDTAHAAPAPHCLTAGTSGFTAAVVATHGQRIAHRMINARNCDVGIYVADGASHVSIDRVTVTGAHDAGILVQNTSHVTITRSVVHGNGLNSVPGPKPRDPVVAGQLDQAFGISLFGVSDSTITGNTVFGNGRGGIGVMDDGPVDPGQVVDRPGTTSPSAPVPSNHVVVSRNTLWANDNGCAIVVSPFNTGDHMGHVTVTRNVIIGTGGADVGGIVAQTNGMNSVLRDVTFSRNTVIGSVEAGVIVHAAAPGSHTADIRVTRNTLIRNNQSAGETGHTTGVVVSTLGPAKNASTTVSRNVILGQYYGVWTSGPNAPTLSRNLIVVTPGGARYQTG